MSLQNATSITQAATAFSQLWTTWLRPAGATAYPGGGPGGSGVRGTARKAAIRTAIQQFSAFLPAITIEFPDLGAGTLGGLNWQEWKLKINSRFFDQDAIPYDDFLELCATAYHETRHAEQVYRSAQGLALGPPNGFTPPDTTTASIIQMGASSGGGVAAKIAAFSGNATANATVRKELIVKLLKVPTGVAQHADTNSGTFNAFTALPKPAWFKRATVKLEVEEWMRSLSKQSLFGMTMWVEGNAGATERTFDMYKDLPVELDAHGIEDSLVSAVEGLVGQTRALQGGQPRTNTGLFGV